MHITVQASTLVLILVGVVILGFLARGLTYRRTRTRTRMRNAPVAPARKSWRAKGGPIARKRDNGAIVARKHGIERSPEWPAVAHPHLLKEPACRACGHRGQGLQVHHIKPFHLHPDLELDPNNLITLCELKGRDHHLLLGHLDDWESYNPNVRQDVKRFYKMSDSQIRADPVWQKEERQRPFA
jgi:hypothetical protein